MSVLRGIMSGFWLAAAVLGGCWSPPSATTPGRTYHTVTAEPLRDTEAAKRHNEAGLRHLADGRLDQAADAFSRALTADVEYGPAHNNLGKVYYRKKDSYKAAWEFEYAAKLLPKHAEPRNNLGMVLEDAGELDRAVDQYREAVGLDGDCIEYRANLVRALIRRGDRTQEVRSLLQQVLKQDGRPEWRAWARQQQSRLGEGS